MLFFEGGYAMFHTHGEVCRDSRFSGVRLFVALCRRFAQRRLSGRLFLLCTVGGRYDFGYR